MAKNSNLLEKIKQWGAELGFQQVGVSDTDLHSAEKHLHDWLGKGRAGQMAYMDKHGSKRSRPALLVDGTVSIISVRMDYLPQTAAKMTANLRDRRRAFVSRYALGRDYHKVMRGKLQKLADKIAGEIGVFGYRVFVDSAPVLEKAIAEKAGLGWIGKHSNLLNRHAGSWFFLGEIYTDIALPVASTVPNHCGSCTACIDICPTRAIVAPYQVDARRCISYLTIELQGTIPVEFRTAIGNRIYGCDDCQLICPWNRYASICDEPDYSPRHNLHREDLLGLFAWSEDDFLAKLEGSAIRRIGYISWLRNIAVALGNSGNGGDNFATIAALRKQNHPSTVVQEHIQWALDKLQTPTI